MFDFLSKLSFAVFMLNRLNGNFICFSDLFLCRKRNDFCSQTKLQRLFLSSCSIIDDFRFEKKRKEAKIVLKH